MSFDLPSLPQGWSYVPLEQLTQKNSITYGVVQPGSHVGHGVPIVRVNNFKDCRIELSEFMRIEPEIESKYGRTRLQGGEVLLTLVGSVGQVAVVPGTLKGFNVARAVAVIHPQHVEPNWLAICLRSPLSQHLLSSRANTTVQTTINLKDLRALPIPMAPECERGKIIELIGSLDDRVSLLRDTNTTLEAIGQALFKSWFVDFDPVHSKAAGLDPEGIDPETAALFPDSFEESPVGLVPKGWSVDRADCWLSVLETGRRPKGGVAGVIEGVPSIGAESIVRIGEFDYSKTKYVSTEFFDKMKSGGVQSHDVLLYKDGGKPGVFLPRVSIFGDGFPFEKCGINEHVFRIRLKEPFNQVFLYYWLWSDAVMHELKHRGGKAAIPGINQADVKELNLLVPDTHALKRFNEITSPLISKIFSNSKQARTLTQLRDSLLPRLISGQLTLPEVEEQIEAVCA